MAKGKNVITNPVLVELTRGGIVESVHRGAFAVVGTSGDLLLAKGDVTRPIFPRSAIKALQALPLVESGAAKAFDLSQQEIALACASHNGEPHHIETARSILRKAGVEEAALECGTHWPLLQSAGRNMAFNKETPSALHNNCSGKHAGMVATAKFLGEEIAGYTKRHHRVQKRIEAIISEFCECDLVAAACGTDGCSVPAWAIPLEKLALGFAKFANSGENSDKRAYAGSEIIAAVRKAPFMVAGSDRFCTTIMSALPRLFAKTGAEGVYCATIPHAGIGIAVKCDDGASRAAQIILISALRAIDVWSNEEQVVLDGFSSVDLKNHNDMVVGEVRACID